MRRARTTEPPPFASMPTRPKLSDFALLADVSLGSASRAGYAFSRSVANSRHAMQSIVCGMVGVNTRAVSTPETPFGGIKQSGHVDEGSIEGLQAYLAVKLFVQA